MSLSRYLWILTVHQIVSRLNVFKWSNQSPDLQLTETLWWDRSIPLTHASLSASVWNQASPHWIVGCMRLGDGIALVKSWPIPNFQASTQAPTNQGSHRGMELMQSTQVQQRERNVIGCFWNVRYCWYHSSRIQGADRISLLQETYSQLNYIITAKCFSRGTQIKSDPQSALSRFKLVFPPRR